MFLAQSWTKYMWNFLHLNVIFSCHQWNGNGSLSPESEYASCLTSCQTNQNLGLRKLDNFKKTSEMLKIKSDNPAGDQKEKLQKLQKEVLKNLL